MKHYVYPSRWSILFILLAVSLASAVSAQDRTIMGTVTAQENTEPIPGVNILVKGTTHGTVSDLDGNYRLTVSDATETLVFSSIGFTTQEVAINGRTQIDLTLASSTQALEEIVVVGYGEQSRETLTSAVSKVDTKVLENVPLANAATALQGTVSGVRVQTESGQPGASPRVIVRGGYFHQ